MILGAIATLFCIYAHVHEYIYLEPFPRNYSVLVICAIGYFFFNAIYNVIDSYMEGN